MDLCCYCSWVWSLRSCFTSCSVNPSVNDILLLLWGANRSCVSENTILQDTLPLCPPSQERLRPCCSRGSCCLLISNTLWPSIPLSSAPHQLHHLFSLGSCQICGTARSPGSMTLFLSDPPMTGSLSSFTFLKTVSFPWLSLLTTSTANLLVVLRLVQLSSLLHLCLSHVWLSVTAHTIDSLKYKRGLQIVDGKVEQQFYRGAKHWRKSMHDFFSLHIFH